MSNRIWVIATALISVALLVAGYFLGVAPRLAEAAKAELERFSVEQQNDVYAADLAALKKQFEGIDDIRDELAELQLSLPADNGSEQFLREVDAAALASGVSVWEILQEGPVIYGDLEGAAAADAAPINGGTLMGVPISITVKYVDDPTPLFTFLSLMQNSTRLFMPNALDLGSEIGGPSDKPIATWTYTIKGYLYTLADPAASTPQVVTPAAPTPEVSPSPDPSGSPAPSGSPSPTP